MDAIQAIAMLCATVVSTGHTWSVNNAKEVLACQKHYINCLQTAKPSLNVIYLDDLAKCVLKREIK